MELTYKINNDATLNKIDEALDQMKEAKVMELSITFTYAELLSFKKELILAHINTELCAENLKEGMAFRQSLVR